MGNDHPASVCALTPVVSIGPQRLYVDSAIRRGAGMLQAGTGRSQLWIPNTFVISP